MATRSATAARIALGGSSGDPAVTLDDSYRVAEQNHAGAVEAEDASVVLLGTITLYSPP